MSDLAAASVRSSVFNGSVKTNLEASQQVGIWQIKRAKGIEPDLLLARVEFPDNTPNQRIEPLQQVARILKIT